MDRRAKKVMSSQRLRLRAPGQVSVGASATAQRGCLLDSYEHAWACNGGPPTNLYKQDLHLKAQFISRAGTIVRPSTPW